MVAAARHGEVRSVALGRRKWGILTLGGVGFATAGIAVLPWFIRTIGPRHRLGSSFIETFDTSAGARAFYVLIVAALVGVAFFAMSDPGRISSWAGIVLAAVMLADGSWKMAEVMNAPAPTDILIGPGYYALMAGSAAVLVSSIMLLVGTYRRTHSPINESVG
ncbi:MAG: hypothetical protein U9R51_07135 [Actinomycetota bacterium]|nr:hypothetical protein [Actinomycetota bacterium]